MAIIETKKLSKKFGILIAVESLNLKIEKGEIFGLIGPNGSGKTTTIKMLCGLLLPTSGTAYVLGRKVPDKSITQSLGYMPQEMALYEGLTVHQNIEFINLEKWRDSL